MFGENDPKALNQLLSEGSIREEFYYYWHDAINAVGYTPKLLLMFSAIESLAKQVNGKKDWKKIEQILVPTEKTLTRLIFLPAQSPSPFAQSTQMPTGTSYFLVSSLGEFSDALHRSCSSVPLGTPAYVWTVMTLVPPP